MRKRSGWRFLATSLGAVLLLALVSGCKTAQEAALEGAAEAASKAASELDKADGSYRYPLEGTVEAIGFSPGERDHVGPDFYAVDLTSDLPTVYPSRPGKVAFRDFNNDSSDPNCSYGNTVAIDHGDGTYAIYTHLARITAPAIGEPVGRSAAIGVMGDSGCPDGGIHLHMAVRRGPTGLIGRLALFDSRLEPVDVGPLQPR